MNAEFLLCHMIGMWMVRNTKLILCVRETVETKVEFYSDGDIEDKIIETLKAGKDVLIFLITVVLYSIILQMHGKI